MRARIRRTTSAITSTNATASAIVRTTIPNEPETAIVVASAIKNQALTSSIAAQPIVSEPTGP